MAEPLVDSTPPLGRPSRPRVPDTLAAIDIGTNSVHMVIARVGGVDRFEVLTRHKEVLRLGSGGGDMRLLSDAAMQRGIAALGRCRRLAESYGAEVTAVATSAVREADNAAAFLRAILDATGIVVEIISGVEEARLIHLGVLQSLPVYDHPLLLCDIGGGSTELLLAVGDDVRAARSFKLGAIRTSRRFGDGSTVTSRQVEGCREHVRDLVAGFRHELGEIGTDELVVSSGTAETLVRMGVLRSGSAGSSLNAASIDRDVLRCVVDDIVAAPGLAERRALVGMDASRADIIVAGSIVLDELCDIFGIRMLTYSDGALREGVLLDALQRVTGGTVAHLSDLRRRSVLHVVELCDEDPDHSLAVARLAGRLFVQLADALMLEAPTGELLDAAALMANVGLVVSHSAHHKHSYYVIRHSEHLMGFTDHEIELIAQIARYHRKAAPSAARHPEFVALDAGDRRVVTASAALLRVAIGLDRSHDGAVGDVDVELEPDVCRVIVRPARPESTDVALEVHAATERAGLLADVLGRPVVVVAEQRV